MENITITNTTKAIKSPSFLKIVLIPSRSIDRNNTPNEASRNITSYNKVAFISFLSLKLPTKN